MYSFLDNLTHDETRDLVVRATRSQPMADLDGAERAELYKVLFAVYGFDLLYEKSIRRALLLTLPTDSLESLAVSCGVEPGGKRFDLALQISGRPWRAGTAIVRRIADVLSIPEAFLPDAVPRNDDVEVVEPFLPLPPLFDYQEELVREIVEVLRGPSGESALMQLPTGAGKTRTTMEALARHLNDCGQAGVVPSVLWLAHTEELCDQAVDSFGRVWRARGQHEIRLARFWANHQPKLQDLEGAFVVSGYQKLVELRKRSPEDYRVLMSFVSVLLVDEAHKALAPTIHSLISSAKKEAGVRVIGLSATPGRGTDSAIENRKLARVFGKELLRPPSLGSDPIGELQARGILSRPERVSIESGIPVDYDGEVDEDGDFSASSLRRLAQDPKRNALIAEAVRSQLEMNRPTLVFCCTVEHARALAVEAAMEGARAAYVDCRMRRGLRRKIVRAFRGGEVDVLFNYGVLSTGFDAPSIECVIVARPTTSIVLYSQMIGRGLRGAEVGGTRSFTLIDVRDNLEAFGDVQEVYAHFDEFWE